MNAQSLLFPGSAVEGAAILSPCGLYRYELRRVWDSSLPMFVVCMINPSTADSTDDDNTIRKLIGFGRRWGFGGFIVVNLFAWRSTESKGIGSKPEHVGPANDDFIRAAICEGQTVVCAWGPKPGIDDRAAHVVSLIVGEGKIPQRIGAPSKDGSPCHPLMLPYSRQLEPMEDAR